MARSLEMIYQEALFTFLQWLAFAGGCVFLLLTIGIMLSMPDKVMESSTRYLIERHGIRVIRSGHKYTATIWIPWRATWLAMKMVLSRTFK